MGKQFYSCFSDGLNALSPHVKDALKSLRELRKSCPLAFQILKILSEGQDTSTVSSIHLLPWKFWKM